MQRKLAMNCNPVDTIKVDGQKLTISYTGIFMFTRFCPTCGKGVSNWCFFNGSSPWFAETLTNQNQFENTYCLIFTDFHPLAVGVLSGSNDYVIDGSTKIKNYHKEEVDAQCQVEDDKLVLTITGGKAGTVKITRLIKDDKLHVEQVIFNSHWSQGQPSCQKVKKYFRKSSRKKSQRGASSKSQTKKTILQSVAGIDCRTHIRPLSFAVRRSLFLSQIHHGASTYNTNYN